MVIASQIVATESVGVMVVSRHVRRALNHMRANLPNRITLADLSAAAALSERGLLRQFERFLGVSPMTHLLRLRLAAARAELLRPESARSVAEIGVGFGLPHLGRFAAEYRKAFGESPSATVRRARAATDGGTGVAEANGSSVAEPAPFVTRPRPSLTVLPLRTETVGERCAAQEIVEQLAATLSRSRAASVSFLDPATPVARQITWASKVSADARYFLQGRLLQRDERIRVTLWLTDDAGRHVWGDSWDAASAALFDFSQKVVERAVCGIVPALTGAEIERLGEKDPRLLGAREMLIRSFPLLMKVDAGHANRALAIAAQAMELDADDALGPAFAAYSRLRLISDGAATEPFAMRSEVLQLAQRAALLDTGDPLVTTALAAVAMLFGSREEAEALVERAVALDPTSGWAWERKGFLHIEDSPELAMACFDRAIRLLGPRLPKENCAVGISLSHRAKQDFERAARFARGVLADNPGAMLCHRFLICYESCLGRPWAAWQSADALRRTHSHFSFSAFHRALPSAGAAEHWTAYGIPP